MKNSILLLLFLKIILISCKGQSSNAKKIELYTDHSGNYKIEFITKPFFKTEERDYSFGKAIWKITFSNKNDSSKFDYLIKYVDFPSDLVTSDSINLLNDLFLATQVDLIKEQKIPYNLEIKEILGFPGREFHFLDSVNNIAYTRQVFLVKNRLYFLEVKYEINSDYSYKIEQFLNSFSLINSTINATPELSSKSPIKKFIIKFPGQTSTKTHVSFSELFGNLTIALESYETASDMYGVNYAILPIDKLNKITDKQIKEFITKAFTSNVLQTNGKIISKKEISINNNWALEGMGSIQNGEIILHIRSVIVKNYYYQILVMYEKDKGNTQKTEAFLNSFELIKE